MSTSDLVSQIQSTVTSAVASTGPAIIQGVITAWNSTGTPPTVSMTISGGSTASDGFRYLESYTPVIGDVVQCVKQNGSILVLGSIATAAYVQYPNLLQDWTSPTPFGGGVTSGGGGAGPVLYRVIMQEGRIKTQLKGSVSISGGVSSSPFGLFTLNNLAAPDAVGRMMTVITTAGLAYIQYDWTDNVANLMGGTGATAVILDGHEFFPNT